MKRLIALLLALLALFPLFSDEITFSSRQSSVSLRDGLESVRLEGDASVVASSLHIRADSISLSGEEWRTIECLGNVLIEDVDRNITIRTSGIWYDRISERLLISSYFEIEDRDNEMSASSNHLDYDMASEMLTMTARVRFSKINGDDVIRGESERVVYDRGENILTLSGNCRVIYGGDEYRAEHISLDMERDELSLNAGIRGTING